MIATFVLPGALRPLAEGQDRVRVYPQRATAEGALRALWTSYPDLRLRIVDEQGRLRPHVNVFVAGESVRYTGGLDTAIADGVEIAIIPAVSGGRGAAPATLIRSRDDDPDDDPRRALSFHRRAASRRR